MLVEPSIESQDMVLENDNRVAIGNHAFDSTLREDLITVHGRSVMPEPRISIVSELRWMYIDRRKVVGFEEIVVVVLLRRIVVVNASRVEE